MAFAKIGFNYWDGRAPKTEIIPANSTGGEDQIVLHYTDRQQIFSVSHEDKIKLVWDEIAEDYQLFTAKQKLPTSSKIQFVITKTIPAAIDAGNGIVEPVTFIGRPFLPVAGEFKFQVTENEDLYFRVASFFLTEISVTPGKCRIAIATITNRPTWNQAPWDTLNPVVIAELDNVDCNEFDYYAPSSELDQ